MNSDMKILSRPSIQREKENFADILVSMQPFFGKIAASIYLASPLALEADFTALFEKTSTMFAVLVKSLGSATAKKILNQADRTDIRRKTWFKNMV